MTTTTVLSEDTATIVRDDAGSFQWGAVVAGSVIATAITFLLVSFGSAVGLTLAAHDGTGWSIGTFLTAGAIYFLIAQAFGFAVGGHVTGRLLGHTTDESEDETFRADAHGLAVWGLGVVFGLAVLALTAGTTLSAGAASRATPANYFSDKLFRPGLHEAAPTADMKAEASRLLTAQAAQKNPDGEDRARLVALVSQGAGLNSNAAAARVDNIEEQMRQKAKDAARAASYLSIWTTLALLFSAAVCVAATLTARWHPDRTVFARRTV